jgi:GNAT superfamily N-acetyltransferase
MPKHSIRPLSPELLDDYLSFFDQDAFCDNPEWQTCYCAYYHCYSPARDQEWEERTGEENRATVRELILTGRMHGYLAYSGDKVVGWCHAAPRVDLPLLPDALDLPREDAGAVGAIVCFVVAKGQRRQGIARQLLDAACQGFRAMGLAYAEAYPYTGRETDAANCHGPLAIYLAAGFWPVRTREDALVVRKALT